MGTRLVVLRDGHDVGVKLLRGQISWDRPLAASPTSVPVYLAPERSDQDTHVR